MTGTDLRLVASNAKALREAESPFDGTTGGGDNGGMEARVAKLEASMEFAQRELGEIKTTLRGHDGKFDGVRDRMERDFRILFGAMIAATLGLAGLMAKGFGWL